MGRRRKRPKPGTFQHMDSRSAKSKKISMTRQRPAELEDTEESETQAQQTEPAPDAQGSESRLPAPPQVFEPPTEKPPSDPLDSTIATEGQQTYPQKADLNAETPEAPHVDPFRTPPTRGNRSESEVRHVSFDMCVKS